MYIDTATAESTNCSCAIFNVHYHFVLRKTSDSSQSSANVPVPGSSNLWYLWFDQPTLAETKGEKRPTMANRRLNEERIKDVHLQR
jgi:hypothetical protein